MIPINTTGRQKFETERKSKTTTKTSTRRTHRLGLSESERVCRSVRCRRRKLKKKRTRRRRRRKSVPLKGMLLKEKGERMEKRNQNERTRSTERPLVNELVLTQKTRSSELGKKKMALFIPVGALKFEQVPLRDRTRSRHVEIICFILFICIYIFCNSVSLVTY